MAAPEELPLPSEGEMLAYLQKREKQGYYADYARSSIALGRTSLILSSGVTGSGKSTLNRKVVELNPDFHEYISSTTRELEERDRGEYVRVTLEQFYKGVQEGTVVNYYVHPSGVIYGTFFDGFTAPYTIGAFGTDTIEQVMGAGFKDVHAVYVLNDAATLERRIRRSRILNPAFAFRIKEGFGSLDFVEQNHKENWLTPIQLSDEPGALEDAADTVARIARHNSVQTIESDRTLQLIGEMRGVLRKLLMEVTE